MRNRFKLAHSTLHISVATAAITAQTQCKRFFLRAPHATEPRTLRRGWQEARIAQARRSGELSAALCARVTEAIRRYPLSRLELEFPAQPCSATAGAMATADGNRL